MNVNLKVNKGSLLVFFGIVIFGALIIAESTVNVIDLSVKPDDYFLEVSRKNILGAEEFDKSGERRDVQEALRGVDVWQGDDSIIPRVDSAGEEMQIVSTNNNDTVGGTGTRQVHIHYLDNESKEYVINIDMNGTTPVDIPSNNVTFINDFHSSAVGSNGVAEGDLKVFQKGNSSRIYSIVKAGGNMNLDTYMKVPAGKTAYLTGWWASATSDKAVAIRLRATTHHHGLYPDVFLFQRTIFLFSDTFYTELKPPIRLEENVEVKMSAWMSQTGLTDISGGFQGVIIDN